ncbi:MAG: cyclic nucleotide-gated ion channel [Xanthobacteraceae bacterium]|nr:cyclic nucleotide-gated ion channel [Xanthobacteraceae bacterium]
MSKLPLLPRLISQTRSGAASWHPTTVTHVALAMGVGALLILTIEPIYAQGRRWIELVLWLCLAVFVWEWTVRLYYSRAKHGVVRYLASPGGIIDTVSALAVPIALAGGIATKSAWLFGAIWLLKLAPELSSLKLLRRVIAIEAGPLASVLAIFVLVLVVASTVVHVLERDEQPEVFGSVPATLWWAVATLTTTGYGDVVPHTPLGRLVAAAVMICGLFIFGLWTGILATGFAAENRRENFIKTWEYVSRVPFFSRLAPGAITDVTQMLRRLDLPPKVTVVRRGAAGDCMYFIAAGEVEVELQEKRIRLGEGAFFGELALLGDSIRTANVVTREVSTLLVLDLVDFRLLMARHPDLSQAIDAEARRRQAENQRGEAPNRDDWTTPGTSHDA